MTSNTGQKPKTIVLSTMIVVFATGMVVGVGTGNFPLFIVSWPAFILLLLLGCFLDEQGGKE